MRLLRKHTVVFLLSIPDFLNISFQGGGSFVSQIRKSYSLSDLSEPDSQRSHDEVDEIWFDQGCQRIHPTKRYLVARNSSQHINGINRSLSTSRAVDVYYDDRMTRSSDNYE